MTTERKTRSRRGAAFTLVEMLAVMAIIAILAGLIAAGSAYIQRDADRKRAQAGLEKIKLALEAYRVRMGRYPNATFNGPINAAAWSQLSTMYPPFRHPDDAIDPWNRPYLYTNRSRFSYLIMSQGPNADPAATWDDITNERAGD